MFAVLYGGFVGTFLALQIPCITQISDIEEVGTRIGVLYSITSFACVAFTQIVAHHEPLTLLTGSSLVDQLPGLY